MQEAIRRQLNAINQKFYRITADAFDQTRSDAWEGWHRLAEHIEQRLPADHTPLSVLDVGCGNGRFGVFLAEKIAGSIRYHGIDSSPELLIKAETSLANTELEYQLERRDLLEVGLPAPAASYDLVVLFGVLHHIPGARERQQLIHDLAQAVSPDGLLVFTTWRFYEFERFRRRIVSWPMELADKVEAHDYLLDWRRGATALRYCHYVDSDELQRLINASGLQPITQYTADGRDAFNQYVILQRTK